MAVDKNLKLTDENRSKRYESLSNEFIVGLGLFGVGLAVAAVSWFSKVDMFVWGGLISSTVGSVLTVHSLLADPRPKN